MRRVAAAVLLLLLAAPVPADALDAVQLGRKLTRQSKLLGPNSGVFVADVASGTPVFALRPTVPRIPASVQKLWTTAAALSTRGPRSRLTTAVLKDQPIGLDGAVHGNLWLRGAGDPTLTSADLRRLARQVQQAGIEAIDGRVVGDATAFDARRGLAYSGFRATSDVPPLSALMVDRGQIREGLVAYQRHPPRFAAARLTRMLRARGVRVRRGAAVGRTPLLGWAVAAVRSPPLRVLLRRQNVLSDNYVAELLLRGLPQHRRASSAQGAAVVRRLARGRWSADPIVVDGSGISRENRSTPRGIAQLLFTQAKRRAFVRSLPIAGRAGTVATRLSGPLTAGRCRLKTGTLNDVSTLAGYCTTLGGQTLALAILQNDVSPFSAHAVQDRMVTTMVRYDP